jgi:hypothetical protein
MITQYAVRDNRIHLARSIICCSDICNVCAGATGRRGATVSEMPLPQAHWQISVSAERTPAFE